MASIQTIDLNNEIKIEKSEVKKELPPPLDLNLDEPTISPLTPEKSKLILNIRNFTTTFKDDLVGSAVDITALNTMTITELEDYYHQLRDLVMCTDNKDNNNNLLGIGCSGLETALCKLNPYNKGVGQKLYDSKPLKKAFQVLMFERGSGILRNPWVVLVSNAAGIILDNNKKNRIDPTFVTDQDKIRKDKIDVNINNELLKKYKTLIE